MFFWLALWVFFSPNGGAQNALAVRLGKTAKTLDAAVYSFTNAALADSLLALKGRGIAVRLITDKLQNAGRGSQVARLTAAGIAVKILGNGAGGLSLMHNKFAVYDTAYISTGSYNWSGAAELSNAENLLILKDKKTAKIYEAEFARLWAK